MNRLGNSFNTDSLKGRLRFFILNLLLFVVLVISIFLIMMTKSQLNETYKNELNAIVKMQIQAVDKWMNEREINIKFLASHSNLDNKSIKNIFETFILNQSEFYSISYVKKDGYTLFDTTFNTSHYFGNENFFLDSLEGMDAISNATISQDGKMPIIYFSSPVFDENGEVIFVAIGAVRLSSVQNIIEDFRFSNTGETFIINEKNQLLTKRKFEKTNETLKIVTHAHIKDGFYKNYSNKDVLGVSKKAHFDRWTITAQIATQEMYKVFKQFVFYIFIFVLALLIILLPLILSFSNKIDRPLKLLLHYSKKIEGGEYGHIIDNDTILHSTIEIRELTYSFNSMSNKLNQVIGELQITSSIDALSQLYNRRELLKISNVMLKKSIQDGKYFAILMVDIDHFKKINDTYGHRTGDVAIFLVANTIKTSITSIDIAGRYGGEEFLVFISDTNLNQAQNIAQRIRINIEKLSIEHEDNKLSCTCSIGLFFPKNLSNSILLENAIEYADQALYKAKESGRNQVIVKII